MDCSSNGQSTKKLAFVVLCGLPAAGKSLFCQELRRTLLISPAKPVVIVLHYDTLIPEITPIHWRNQRREVLDTVDHLVRSVCVPGSGGKAKQTVMRMEERILTENHLSPGFLVESSLILIFDDNMYYRSMRYEVYRTAVSLGAGSCQVFLDVMPDIAKARNRDRQLPVTDSVIDRMNMVMEKPDGQKYRYEHRSCSVASPWTNLELEKVVNLIITTLNDPIQILDPAEDKRISREKTRAQEINQKSICHFADLFLRNLVSEQRRMSACEQQMKMANECRRIVLQNLKRLDLPCFELETSYSDILKSYLTSEFERLLKSEKNNL